MKSETTSPAIDPKAPKRHDSWITKRLLSIFGPADTSPIGAEPDSSGHGARLCPKCAQPFANHDYDRSDETSRIYCPEVS